MASNPRIDDLRRRLEKEPNSRLFAQLAEELRKDGEFEEAIRIARAGLARHAAYPSARMTLGRALFDTGDLAAARHELESVLVGAPDNILASRLLAECLEGLGDLEGALERYRATLALSAGDKQIAARVRDLEGRVAAVARPGPGAAEPPPAGSAAEPAPIPLAIVDEPMVLEISQERPAPGSAPPPVPVAEAAAEFELESAYEAPGSQWQGASAAGSPVAATPAVSEPDTTNADRGAAVEAPAPTDEPGERTLADVPAPVLEPERPAPEGAFEEAFDTAAAVPPAAEPAPPPPMPPLPGPATVPAPTPAITAEPAVATPPAVAVAREAPPPSEAEPVPEAPPPPAPAPGPRDDADLVSPTLAELYLNQGFPEKAIEVYSRLLEREPGNERARARVTELREAGGAPRAETPPAGDADQARAARREALERTIERLESLRAALQKGPR